jgi:hypothetical protein
MYTLIQLIIDHNISNFGFNVFHQLKGRGSNCMSDVQEYKKIETYICNDILSVGL